MKKTGLLKRAGVAVMTAALMVTAVACNTKIKVNFEAKASDYVKLGQYKGITVSVDEQAIENELIEKIKVVKLQLSQVRTVNAPAGQ